MSAAVTRFQHTTVPPQPGERARLRVLEGPDKGATFIVTSIPITIGRGEGADIRLADLKASRMHARLGMNGGHWEAVDLGSANGIASGTDITKKLILKGGIQFKIGETVLEFSSAEVMPLLEGGKNSERVKAITQFEGLKGIGALFKTNSSSPGVTSAGNSRKLIVRGLLGIMVLFLLFGEDTPDKNKQQADNSKKSKTEKKEGRDLAQYLPKNSEMMDPEVVQVVDRFFWSGFREYQNGNFLRAKNEFQTVLQVDPTHQMARRYLENCDLKITEEVEDHLKQGAQSMNLGRYRAARGYFESVQRLLFYDQSSPGYIEATEQLEKLSKLEKGLRDST